MDHSRDVIVFDEEYISAADQISNYGEALIQLMDEYTSIMETVLGGAIRDEKISEKLRAILEQLPPIKSHIKSLCGEAKDFCKNYVTEIDSADQFLY